MPLSALHMFHVPVTGLDIARLVSQQAAQVYVCAREWRTAKDIAAPGVRGCGNVQRRGMINRLTAAGGPF